MDAVYDCVQLTFAYRFFINIFETGEGRNSIGIGFDIGGVIDEEDCEGTREKLRMYPHIDRTCYELPICNHTYVR